MRSIRVCVSSSHITTGPLVPSVVQNRNNFFPGPFLLIPSTVCYGKTKWENEVELRQSKPKYYSVPRRSKSSSPAFSGTIQLRPHRSAGGRWRRRRRDIDWGRRCGPFTRSLIRARSRKAVTTLSRAGWQGGCVTRAFRVPNIRSQMARG